MSDRLPLPAGPELNALVAEKVMGERVEPYADAHEWGHEWGEDFYVADYHTGKACVRPGCPAVWLYCCEDEPERPCEPWVRRYSTNRATSLLVLDRLIELGFEPIMEYDAKTDTWWVAPHTVEGPKSECFGHADPREPDWFGRAAPTLPLAICHAALQAVEVLEDDAIESAPSTDDE